MDGPMRRTRKIRIKIRTLQAQQTKKTRNLLQMQRVLKPQKKDKRKNRKMTNLLVALARHHRVHQRTLKTNKTNKSQEMDSSNQASLRSLSKISIWRTLQRWHQATRTNHLSNLSSREWRLKRRRRDQMSTHQEGIDQHWTNLLQSVEIQHLITKRLQRIIKQQPRAL